MKVPLDLSSSSCVTAGLRSDFGSRPGLTNLFIDRVIAVNDHSFPEYREIEMHILAVDISCLCALTLAENTWRGTIQSSKAFSDDWETRYLGYRRADFCLRTLFFRFPDYFEPEDFQAAASMLTVDCMKDKHIDSAAREFAASYTLYAMASKLEPLRGYSYASYEMQAVRREGMAARVVQMFSQFTSVAV